MLLGSSVPRTRKARRKARPTPLKHASTMWCVFSPRTSTWIAAPRLSASERKKWGTSSVGKPPTAVALEPAGEDRIGAAGEVDGDLRECLVHRQHEPEASDAALVAEGFPQGLPERQRAILDRVMLVHVEVALAA